MVKWLKKKYESPIDAERVFFPKASVGTQTNLSTNRSIGSQTDLSSRSIGSQTDLSSRSIGSQTDLSTSNSIASQTDLSSRSIITSQSAHFSDLSYSQSASDDVIYMPNASEQSSISTLSQTFSAHCKKSLQLDVPVDFLAYAGTAMARLKENGRANVVYNLVKGVGKDRPDSSNSRFPVSRMPMGLIEYATNFYIAENINQVSVTLYFLSMLHTVNSYPLRYLLVLRITNHGYKLCTLSLGKNGLSYIMVQCGALLAHIIALIYMRDPL